MRIKIFLFPIITIITLYLIIAQIFPDVQRTRTARDGIAQKQAELTLVQDRQIHITALRGSFAQNNTDYEEVFSAVPKTRETEFMINQIGKLVQKHGMTLTLMGFQDGKNVGRRNTRIVAVDGAPNTVDVKPQKMQITADIAGSYESVRKFLTEVFFLGRAGQFVNVDIERIAPEENEDGQKTLQDFLTMTVVFDYYTMPDFKVSDPQTFTHSLIENTDAKFDYSRAAAWRANITEGLSGIAPIEGEHGNNPFLP